MLKGSPSTFQQRARSSPTAGGAGGAVECGGEAPLPSKCHLASGIMVSRRRVLNALHVWLQCKLALQILYSFLIHFTYCTVCVRNRYTC